HDVCLDVMREVVGRITFERRVHRAFRTFGVANLLMGKGPDGLGAIIAWQVGGPAGRNAVGLFQYWLRLAVSEPDRIGDAECQQVGGVRIQDLPPDPEGFVERSAMP